MAKGSSHVSALGPDNATVIETGEVSVIDNADRPDDRHGADQGDLRQYDAAAVAGAIRQCAACRRHDQTGRRRAEHGDPARPQRRLRLHARPGRRGDAEERDDRAAGREHRGRDAGTGGGRAVVTSGFARLSNGAKVHVVKALEEDASIGSPPAAPAQTRMQDPVRRNHVAGRRRPARRPPPTRRAARERRFVRRDANEMI